MRLACFNLGLPQPADQFAARALLPPCSEVAVAALTADSPTPPPRPVGCNIQRRQARNHLLASGQQRTWLRLWVKARQIAQATRCSNCRRRTL